MSKMNKFLRLKKHINKEINMANNKLSNEQTRSIISAAVLLIIGILLCIEPAVGDVISIIIGVAFLAAAAILIIYSLVQEKSIITGVALLGGILLVIGLMFVVDQSTFKIVNYCATWLLIVFGAIFIVDSIIRIAWRNRKDVVGFVIEFLIGAAAFTIGMCMRFVDEFRGYEILILGLVIVIYALYLLVFTFLGKKASKK